MLLLSAPRATLTLILGCLCSLVLYPATASAARVTLKWTDNSSNESGFKIERATGSGAFAVIATTAANATSYVDESPAAGTLYRYRLCAFNSAGSSGYTNIASTTVPATANTAPTLGAIANQSMKEDVTSGAIALTIGDAQTSAGELGLSATSSNASLIPESSIVFGGSGANRTLTMKPAADKSGTSTITVKVTDGSLSATRSFVATVTAVNDSPTISNIADQSLATSTTSRAIPFTVGDVETAATSLTVTATSSNTTLLPAAGITLGGTGSSRTLTLKPASGKTGTATITVQVSDGSLTARDTFSLTVGSSSTAPAGTAPANTAPTISSIATQTVSMNASSPALAFTVGDAQTSAGSLKVTASVSNAALLPVSGVTLAGTGANRTVTVRPLTNSTGSCTVKLTVSDGTLSTTTSFTVNVVVRLTGVDIGKPQVAGKTTASGTSVTIVGAGADIAAKNDQFHFAHTPLSGDSEVTVRVASLVNTHGWAKAGIMFRSSTAANSPFVMACVTPTNGIWLYARKTTTQNAYRVALEAGAAPKWLKLTRAGDTFYAFYSNDGKAWNLLDSVIIDLPDEALVGLGVTSHSAATSTTAKFEQLKVD